MVRFCGIACIALALAVAPGAVPAQAQFVPPPPELQNRIPAPLPPPAPPPVINGPLGQSPPPGVYWPDRLTTHGDRVSQCHAQGADYGLHGKRLQYYVRRCANAH